MRANSALVTEPAQSWKRLQGAIAFKNSTKIEIHLPRRNKKGTAQHWSAATAALDYYL